MSVTALAAGTSTSADAMSLRYLLDANVLSEPMRARPDPGVLARLLAVGNAAATAAPAWHEIDFGRLRLPKGRRRQSIDEMVAALERVLVVLPYDAPAARWHARERARLAKTGKMPPFVDGQIAAVAAVNELTLVTRNVRDFAAFAGVSVDSWFTEE